MSDKLDFLTAMAALAMSEFVPLDDLRDFHDAAHFESRDWMGTVFDERYDPYEVPAAGHAVRLWSTQTGGFDLVRHDYTQDLLKVTVIESVSIVYVYIHSTNPEGRSASDPAATASALASRILDLNGPMELRDAADGWLSSAPALDEDHIDQWTDRIDARVRGHDVQLVIWKQDAELTPAGPRNLSLWFGGHFRDWATRKLSEQASP